MFTTNQHTNAGFSMTFKNGWTVSVQFSKDNSCDNRFDDSSKTRCPNAEIAAWDNNTDRRYSFNDDTVKGWVNADEVARFIGEIQRKKPNG
jgi:hypothetical protein